MDGSEWHDHEVHRFLLVLQSGDYMGPAGVVALELVRSRMIMKYYDLDILAVE